MTEAHGVAWDTVVRELSRPGPHAPGLFGLSGLSGTQPTEGLIVARRPCALPV